MIRAGRKYFLGLFLTACFFLSVADASEPKIPAARPENVAAGPDPTQRVERRELETRIQAALMELPPVYREAFVLKHVDELSHAEMCDLLGISRAAVKVRIHRACQMLRTLLTEGAGAKGALR